MLQNEASKMDHFSSRGASRKGGEGIEENFVCFVTVLFPSSYSSSQSSFGELAHILHKLVVDGMKQKEAIMSKAEIRIGLENLAILMVVAGMFWVIVL